MCLIMTLLAAVITTVLWYFRSRKGKTSLGMLSLIYWGAGIMWLVDGFFCLAAGEPFFDISVRDTMLGAIVIVAGIVVWSGIAVYK
ncbi:MAG: hypothetical protein RR994_01450, partial [Clostridia bacterium]